MRDLFNKKTMQEKFVYFFREGNASQKKLLGGKGANLNEMTNLGIPVPPGYTITTDVCRYYWENHKKYPSKLQEQIEENIGRLEKKMGKNFGDKNNPLLVSVRSGAAISMPGMMDTILNLGLNDKTVIGLAKLSGNERFAWDSYRRFIQMFGNVVMSVDTSKFEEILENQKQTKGIEDDTELDAGDLKNVVWKYKELYERETKTSFPQNPEEQLDLAGKAVFDSWNNERAIVYRRLNDIPGNLGTAVNVQAMVFGNLGETSGTGVAFTRNPSTGENKFYGEYLMNAQGEDVVSGSRTPKPVEALRRKNSEIYSQLEQIYKKLENHYRDMQDIEFTIEQGKLFILQTRTGKRTAAAAVKIACDMVEEKLISREEAVLRVDPNSLDQLLHPSLNEIAKEKAKELAAGLPASPGAAVGRIVFTADEAFAQEQEGEAVILVRNETSPEDIQGMASAKGILTSRGGMTSHAAVVARGMGKCCVAGCGEAKIDENTKIVRFGEKELKEGDWITLDGSAGKVYLGQLQTQEPKLSGDFEKLMKWADEFRKLEIRANADTPQDAELARNFGAEGVGLARTEHMFFEGDRIKAVREMILARDKEGRQQAIGKLLPMQRKDFIGIFKAMRDLPVTVRLLDPPLHEFLPKEEAEIQELAHEMGVDIKKLKDKIGELAEFNPMLGFRGVRLAMVYPEIAEMQATAIIQATIELKKQNIKAIPEIEIPVVSCLKEAEFLRELIDKTAKELAELNQVEIEYSVGTMIELPRACVIADKLAEVMDFFSFGTNDLTQTTFGFSRDDAGKFIPKYAEMGVFEKDPFQVIDQEGVGALMKLAVEKARQTKKDFTLGICGEHGGEPKSVEFCHRIGLSNVSCSPYRVPIARLAAAQAALKEKHK